METEEDNCVSWALNTASQRKENRTATTTERKIYLSISLHVYFKKFIGKQNIHDDDEDVEKSGDY